LTIITNPYFWIIIGVIFFPLNLLNYLILFVVNGLILLGNVIIFVAFLIVYLIIGLVVILLNVIINIFNGLSFTIPMPSPFDDITINLPNLPLLGMPSFPAFGVIPYVDIEDVRVFETNKILLLWIFELIGVSFPF